MQRNGWKQWFLFSKRERNAVIILLCALALVIILPYFVPAKKLNIHVDEKLQAELDSYRIEHPGNQSYYTNRVDTTTYDSAKKELFYFDPNTLDEEGFAKLGLPQKTIRILINYRSKGGYFKTPEDIRKIYGLSKPDADRLVPYIRIASSNKKQKEETRYEATVEKTPHQYKKININTATAEDWKAFYGIGDVLANRIVKFRNSIGGFKYIDQVAKTYGLSDSVFQNIKPYLYLKDE